ncbi:g2896 [Coccomyxa elongata]
MIAGVTAAGLISVPGVVLASPTSVYDFTVTQYGKERTLKEFDGQNRNYGSLRRLYEKYRDSGFNLIAFPCNQFGGQAPRSSDGEREFAYKKFGFEFPIMDKIDVNGNDAHPLWTFMKEQTKSGDIKWNYTKFLIDRKGVPRKCFGSLVDPIDFEDDVRLLLGGKDLLPPECARHPGRKACNVDAILAS